ncbi:hypothetical protein [Enterococcus durans]|uniref:hypothetical protein n=1 Tax=Enterococcus durans TaxID=53345 RepID=UPI001F034B4A|nr:hypothetical protein [Enterococcus durans]
MVDATHCAIGNPGYFRHAVDWQHPTLDAGSCANTGGCMDTGTSAGTINEWVKKGLKVIIFGENSRPKYDIKDIDEFMAKYKV